MQGTFVLIHLMFSGCGNENNSTAKMEKDSLVFNFKDEQMFSLNYRLLALGDFSGCVDRFLLAVDSKENIALSHNGHDRIYLFKANGILFDTLMLGNFKLGKMSFDNYDVLTCCDAAKGAIVKFKGDNVETFAFDDLSDWLSQTESFFDDNWIAPIERLRLSDVNSSDSIRFNSWFSFFFNREDSCVYESVGKILIRHHTNGEYGVNDLFYFSGSCDSEYYELLKVNMKKGYIVFYDGGKRLAWGPINGEKITPLAIQVDFSIPSFCRSRLKGSVWGTVKIDGDSVSIHKWNF